VAIVPEQTSLARAGRLFCHPLLDENSQSHVALGEAYGFCLRRPNPPALNRSLVHVDLPLDASLMLPGMEPA
jgi:aminopeptidase